jgi:hypothetical protein
MGWPAIKHDFVLDEDEYGEFCVIPVGRKVKYFAKVDAADFELVRCHRWSMVPCVIKGRVLRYATTYGGRDGNGDKKQIKMHRAIMEVKNPKIKIDHINGDGLDNRRRNLRIATLSQNNWNRRASADKESKYKGVFWHKRDKKWNAQIRYLGEGMWLGAFARNVVGGTDLGELAAARAYDKAAVKYFGVFARLNFEEEKMAYVLNKDEIKRANALVKELNSREKMSLEAWLMGQSVSDLELLCRFVGCNISGLARGLQNYTQTKTEDRRQK